MKPAGEILVLIFIGPTGELLCIYIPWYKIYQYHMNYTISGQIYYSMYKKIKYSFDCTMQVFLPNKPPLYTERLYTQELAYKLNTIAYK